jgi:hypothetical protein
MHFMQTAPWLGLFPGADGQILHSQDGGDSPVVNLFKSATAAIVSNPGCPNPTSFYTMSKQAEAAGALFISLQMVYCCLFDQLFRDKKTYQFFDSTIIVLFVQ